MIGRGFLVFRRNSPSSPSLPIPFPLPFPFLFPFPQKRKCYSSNLVRNSDKEHGSDIEKERKGKEEGSREPSSSFVEVLSTPFSLFPFLSLPPLFFPFPPLSISFFLLIVLSTFLSFSHSSAFLSFPFPLSLPLISLSFLK